jgi:hypothetical protein
MADPNHEQGTNHRLQVLSAFGDTMRLFVSYRNVNRALVQELVGDLRDMGHEVWYDQALEGGQKWWDNILENIRRSDVLLSALSPQSLDSRACQIELTYANALSKHILPVLLAGDLNIALLPVILQERQLVDYRGRDKEAYKALAHALGSLPPSVPLPDPLPDEPPVPISPLAPLRAKIDSPTLTYEEQLAVFHQLKSLAGNPEYTGDARGLLQRLSDHPSLLASVLKEIDTVLGEPMPERPAPETVVAPSTVPSPDFELRPGERLVDEIGVKLVKTWYNIDGRLAITDQRLYFYTSTLGAIFSRQSVEIPLEEITGLKKKGVKLLSPVIQIQTRSGQVHSFSLFSGLSIIPSNPDEVIARIESVLPRR